MGSEQKRIMLAVVLSGLVLFGWQKYFAPVQKAPVSKEFSIKNKQAEVAVEKLKATEASKVANKTTPSISLDLQDFSVSNSKNKYFFNNALAIKNIKSDNAVFAFNEVAGSEVPFQVFIGTANGFQEIVFDATVVDSGKLTGKNSKYGIEMEASLSDSGKFHFNLKSNSAYKYRFVIKSKEAELENRQIRSFVTFGKDVNRTTVQDSDSGEGSLKWFGIDFNYHLFAFVMKEKTKVKWSAHESGEFTVDSIEALNNLNGYLVFSKKNYDDLVKLGDKLDLSVDFGFFGIFAVPILRGLQWIYKYVPNYGLSIIFLTLFIRLLLFPLNLKSFKSMKKMQKVQPELAKLKEKYADDPQRMQKETMALFKKAGANPLGGCLPMIMQMPVFFAFYQVLYNAVELVEAPFYFWITDLSVKDPNYVLPVLMGIAFFAQTKLNPSTTVDPTQKKMMMAMPLVFCFFMKDLPAGLNLYMFISTLFGVTQQLLVYKYSD